MPEEQSKTVQDILNNYKWALHGAAENEATKQLSKDLADMAKEYDGIPAIVAKYQAAHATLSGPMMHAARIQRDEAEGWCDDRGEVSEPLRSALKALWEIYDKRADSIDQTRADAWASLDDILSAFDGAKTSEATALTIFTGTKAYETKANGRFADLAELHKAAKADRDAGNFRRVFARFLEIDDIWTNALVPAFDPQRGAATPEWLLRRLNTDLKALIDAKHRRFDCHKELLEKQKALETAQAEYKSFIEDNNRRKEFLREAEDIEPMQSDTNPPEVAPVPEEPEPAVPEPTTPALTEAAAKEAIPTAA